MTGNRLANTSWLIMAVAATILLAGCGPHPIPATGTVTLDGQPLDEAVILFVPVHENRQKTGSTIEEGRFEISAADGLLPGSYRVEIADNPPLDGPRHPHGAPSPRRLIPYAYAHHSPLTAEVAEDDESVTLDLELSSTGP